MSDPGPRHPDRIRRLSAVLRGVLMFWGAGLLLLPLILDGLGGRPLAVDKREAVVMAIGLTYLLLALVLHRLPVVFFKLALLLIMLPLAVGLLESVGRLARLDFAQTRQQWERTPIYYRQPTEPFGSVFFRRAGPASWQGKVLTTELRRMQIAEWEAYPDEVELTISYDEQGFRNPVEMTDWEIAIAGDSFTELGYLSERDLFTSRLASLLKVRVKNLGVSYTGTFSQLCYLQEFGIAASTRDVMIVFFEGNDWADTLREYQAVRRWEATGEREFRNLADHRQTSFVRAVGDLASHFFGAARQKSAVNAWFTGGKDKTALTLVTAPPNWEELDPLAREALQVAIQQFARLARDHRVRPWLVYMPCKRRVLHGQLEFADDCDPRIVSWQPSDLRGRMESLCEEHLVQWVDLTGPFRQQTRAGKLLFNHIYDTHLNREGAALVAETLAGALQAADDREEELAMPERQQPESQRP